MRDRKELFFTVSSRFIALISTFGIVLISSILLGAEGRGYISLTLTDAALVAIFSNVISGSSAMYFLNKMGEGKVFFSAFLWILFCSMISTALSFHTLVYNQLFANQQFIKGNFLSILVQVAFLTALLPLFIFELPMTWEMYFVIQISIWFLVTLLFLKHTKIGLVNLSELKTIFNYGIKNELSFFLQFFSYRLSYFFIFHQLGVRSLGVFGVMVIIAESVWVISKSFSTVSFAKQLKDEDIAGSVERTNYYTKFLKIGILYFLQVNFLDYKKSYWLCHPGF